MLYINDMLNEIIKMIELSKNTKGQDWRHNINQIKIKINEYAKEYHESKVHVILELKSEDYHGTYKEIVAVYSNEEDCKAKLKELKEENHYYNIEYWHEVFNVL